MSKHKALELAEQLDDLHDVEERPIDKETAAELRAMHDREQRQHALIVQMREALSDIERGPQHPGTIQGVGLKDWVSFAHEARAIAHDALAAADQYLGEQA